MTDGSGAPSPPPAGSHGWLLRDGTVLAALEIAREGAARRKGLLGRDGLEGALLIDGCRWVHTLGMRFAVDVAYVDRDGIVLKIVRMTPQRVGLPMPKARTVVEAEAGAFARWGLHVGDTVDVRMP